MSLYVYAVLARSPRAAMGIGIGRARVRIMRCGGLFVAVGAVRTAPVMSARAVRMHDAVVRRLAAGVEAVLPARFGTVFADGTALARSLAERETALRVALRLVEGREQMTLRVYGATAAAPPAPDGSGDPHDDGGAETRGARGSGTRYLAGRARRHQVAALAQLRPFLGGVVVAERVERHAAPPLVASAYHLIPRGASKDYRSRLTRASPALAPLRVRVSGPWPAYAFAPGPA
ncbi:MAG TPA: GvpL/GvpF family gas vesicle protein [Methylomirabilota bacterium]|jgi:hypothetical protein